MFDIGRKTKYLEQLKEQIEKEKKCLQFLKEQLEDKSEKIDISNVYVWKDVDTGESIKNAYTDVRGIIKKTYYSLVYLSVVPMIGKDKWGRTVQGYRSTLTDVFSKNVIYERKSIEAIEFPVEIFASLGHTHRGYLYPIYEIDKDLLAFTNKMVPLYYLQQLYYQLNEIDVSSLKLKKDN